MDLLERAYSPKCRYMRYFVLRKARCNRVRNPARTNPERSKSTKAQAKTTMKNVAQEIDTCIYLGPPGRAPILCTHCICVCTKVSIPSAMFFTQTKEERHEEPTKVHWTGYTVKSRSKTLNNNCPTCGPHTGSRLLAHMPDRK